jgi:hypothetical protein
MRSTITKALLLGLVVVPALASEGDQGVALLKARIVQLESQVQRLTAENTVLKAQLVMANQSKEAQTLRERQQAVEQDAGCPIDWLATPPVCQGDAAR